MPPPPGIKPNFANPESLAPQAKTSIVISSVAVLLCILLRVYSRLAIANVWGTEDCKSVLLLRWHIPFLGSVMHIHFLGSVMQFAHEFLPFISGRGSTNDLVGTDMSQM
jgi:peptidoglycan biosynthesis protein MviN/MurJ (putative lipid II flippase)